MRSSASKLTYQDLVALPDDGKRHEIVDGELYVSPSPTLRHQVVLRSLFRALDGFVRDKGLGEVLFAPVDVLLSPHDVLEPDLLYVARERAALLPFAGAYVDGPPDLVVEVLSPSTRKTDMTVKRRAYQRWNVGEYWILDLGDPLAPGRETVSVYRGRSIWLRPALHLSRERGDGPLVSPLFPGLALPLADLFA